MKKKNLILSVLLLVSFLLGSATGTVYAQNDNKVSKWPRGVTYEIFVQSFADSNGDGIGDINGMTSKLDYLQELGVEGVWLMPMSPSPSYHKYDVTDYYDIHPDYGTLEDFKKFVNEAHKRGIKVVIDLVLNHSSREHPWFKEAIANRDSLYRNYYVWTHEDDPKTKSEGKIIAGDSDNRNRWNKVEGSEYLYYSYFGPHMPDLNFDNPKLREEIFKIGKFWLSEVNVDGFRLDAARHIFPDERPQDNHQWWVYFRNEMQKAKEELYLVGEVWAPAEVVGPYMKGLPALFNFDMGGAITNAVNQEEEGSLIADHKKIRDFYESVNPEFIDATFLTNHDQNRIMSTVNNNEDKAKMAAALLLTLPGSPYLYYGEEIGMRGKKPDPNIREPFLWDAEKKDKNRTTWIEPEYSTGSSVVPASQQMKDKNSMYNHYKTFIQLRNNSKALTYGELEPVDLGNEKLTAFVRSTEEESLLVVHNLSDTDINVELPEDLLEYEEVIFQNRGADLQNKKLTIPGYSTIILQK